MQYQEQLHTILSRNSRLILLTCCIVAVGILLRVLPGDFILAKPFHLLELDLQDLRAEWRFSLSGGATANSASSRSEVALVTIGDNELDQHGFPMDRGAIADVVTTLKKHSAKVIAFDITFESEWDEVGTKRLARASQGGNVIYPVVMTDHWIVGRDASLIPSALKNHLSPPKDNSPIPGMVPVRLPQETLLSSSVGLGHILAPIDLDGKTRRVPLVIPGRDGEFYLSLGLMAVCRFHRIPDDGIIVEWGKRIILDNRVEGEKRWRAEIPIDRNGYMRLNDTRKLRSFPGHAFSEVYREGRKIFGLDKPELSLDDYNGKVVLIGYIDGSDQTATALEPKSSGVVVHATVVDNILRKNFAREASWGLDTLVLALFTGLMVFSQVYPYQFSEHRPPQAVYRRLTAIAVGILLGFAAINFIVFCVSGLFFNLSIPLVSMALICFTAMGYRYVTNIHDLERKTLQQKLRNERLKLQNERLEERKKDSEEFAHYLSHEFRNPIGSMDSLVDQLAKKINDPASPYIKYIHRIRMAVDLLKNKQANIEHGLFRIARLQEIELESGDLNRVVEETLEIINISPNTTQIQLDKILADLPPIQLNHYWLKEAINNIITNAIQAMPNGGLLSIETKSDENKVILRIDDEGHGISKENLPKIFTAWFTTKTNGRGIGLCMVRDIVKLHGGEIQCNSQEGKGTQFILKFPQLGGKNDTNFR